MSRYCKEFGCREKPCATDEYCKEHLRRFSLPTIWINRETGEVSQGRPTSLGDELRDRVRNARRDAIHESQSWWNEQMRVIRSKMTLSAELGNSIHRHSFEEALTNEQMNVIKTWAAEEDLRVEFNELMMPKRMTISWSEDDNV